MRRQHDTDLKLAALPVRKVQAVPPFQHHRRRGRQVMPQLPVGTDNITQDRSVNNA